MNERRHGPPVIDDWSEDPWDDVVQVEGLVPIESFDRLPRTGRGWRWVLALVGILIVSLAVVGGLTARWIMHQINPPGEPGPPVEIVIIDGMTVTDVATVLDAAGVIGSPRVFRWYAGTKDSFSVVPGTYLIPPRQSFSEIIDQLSTPPEQIFDKVTFPEGFTLEQIANRLEERIPRLSAQRFLDLAQSGQVVSTLAPVGSTNLEGMLFPDTYQVANTDDELVVLTRMVDLMDRIAGRARVDTKPNPYGVMIVASLVEREAKVTADRAKIARVIYNRLTLDMTLDIDAALLYGTPGAQTGITNEMKEADSPFNLYRVKGLPPTPISNPSRASIEAAMNPGEGTWLYYVIADADGTHVFADTYEEHLANVEKARAAGLLG